MFLIWGDFGTIFQSIYIVFEEIKFSIEQLEEVLNRKIDRVKEDVSNLEDTFESYKRSSNRTIREMKQNIYKRAN